MKVLFLALVFALACLAAPQNQTGYSSENVLRISKERSPRVDGLDRLLFNLDELEYANPRIVRDLETEKMTRDQLESMLNVALGEDWSNQVSIPSEDLTMIEALRLATHLNEINLQMYNNHKAARWSEMGERGGYSYSEPYCFCHSTGKHYGSYSLDYSGYNMEHGYHQPTGPFQGIRLFSAHGAKGGHYKRWSEMGPSSEHGYGYGYHGEEHGEESYGYGYHESSESYYHYEKPVTDCILANEETDPDLAMNVKRCCHGFCVVTGEGRVKEDSELDWCDGEGDTEEVQFANRYVCRKNCHLETCDCRQLTYGYHERHCPCNDDWVNLRDDCDCDTVLEGVGCSCGELLHIGDEYAGCECADALEHFCDDCDETLRAAYDYASDCDCDSHINYLDEFREVGENACTCAMGAEHLCKDCCQVFSVLEGDNGDDNTGNCERYGNPDTHAGYIAECCELP